MVGCGSGIYVLQRGEKGEYLELYIEHAVMYLTAETPSVALRKLRMAESAQHTVP